jgi:hypothetical protein
MTFVIDASDPRTVKALQIAASAGQWLKCRTVDGEVAVGIPSQCAQKPGLYYVVTDSTCICEDFKRNGLSRGRVGEAGFHGACKHILALRLHDELVMALAQQPKRRTLRALPRVTDGVHPPLACGCVLRNADGRCSHQTPPLAPITDAPVGRIWNTQRED